MKNLLTLFLVIVATTCIQAQISKLDSLIKLRSQHVPGEFHYKLIEESIIKEIADKGYETTFTTASSFGIIVTSYPGSGSKIGTLYNGDKVLVTGKYKVYYQIRINNKTGYVYMSSASMPFPLTILNDQKHRTFINDLSGYTVQSKPTVVSKSSTYHNTPKYSTPVYISSPPPISKSTYSSSDCSASQCTGKTQKGTRCRRRTKNCSGRCYHH